MANRQPYELTGKTFTYSRSLAGYYNIIIGSGGFPDADKVFPDIVKDGFGREYSISVASANTINIIAAAAGLEADGLLTKARITIRVYN